MADDRRPGLMRAALAALACVAIGAGTPVHAQVAMPAASEMSGIPLPSGDLEDGVIVVRLVRGQLSNNIVDHPVELRGAGEARTVSTDDAGRARFTDVPAGASVRAVAEFEGGERVESQAFAVPATGGVRLMLVAKAGGAEATGSAAEPARPGTVALGGESRFVLELGDDSLEVYYLFDLVNAGASAVAPDDPVTFELPAAATGTAVLEGSSAQARLNGTRLEVVPPFPPGLTHVEVAFFLPYGNGTVAVSQQLPVALTQLTVIAQRPPGLQLESAQLATRRDVESQGQSFIVANGPGLSAGETVQLQVSGLPHYSTLPTTVALILASIIIAIGFWNAFDHGASDGATPRVRLESRRETLFAALARVEEDRRAGRMDEGRYAARRRELVGQLERIYRSLDEPVTT